MVNAPGGCEPRVLELIHGEIDGANTPAQSAELAGILDRDPEARRSLEELKALAGHLDRMADVPPPAELRRTVMAVVAARSRPTRRTRGGSLGWSWPGRVPAIRYALLLVMVAGLVGVATWWRTLTGIPVDEGSVSGTLAPGREPGQEHPPAAGAGGSAMWTIRAEGASGTIRVVDDPDGIRLVFDVRGTGPLSVGVVFDPGRARFAGADGEAGAAVRVEEAGDGAVSIIPAPGSPVAARFERLGEAGTVVGVKLRRGEVVIQEWTLEIPARQGSR
jgi:hypothetical protein